MEKRNFMTSIRTPSDRDAKCRSDGSFIIDDFIDGIDMQGGFSKSASASSSIRFDADDEESDMDGSKAD